MKFRRSPSRFHLAILTVSVSAFASGSPGEAQAAASTPDRGRPNILLITLDTTRADHLGCYGYERNTTPQLDRLAADSVVFDHAYSTSSWTLPAHASLLTGKFPTSHGARYQRDGVLGLRDGIAGEEGELGRYRVNPLPEQPPTLAELLGAAGYRTGAVVGGPWMKQIFGLGRGFDIYDDDEISAENNAKSTEDPTLHVVRGRLASQVSHRAIEFIDSNTDVPFLLFLNFYDPHLPFSDPDGLASMFVRDGNVAYPRPERALSIPEQSAYYDGEIRYMDRFLGRVFNRLKDRGLYEGTWIIVTADHGELLGEKHATIGHGESLYQGEVRIPLIIKFPYDEVPPGRSDRIMQLTDVLPMLMERLSQTTPTGMAALPPARREAFAELNTSQVKSGADDWKMLLSGDYKLLARGDGRQLLFNIADDPSEQRDLAAEQPERVSALSARLDELVADLPQAEVDAARGEVDAETRRALESLGYLE